MMRRALSDFPVRSVGSRFHAVVVRKWRDHFHDYTLKFLGRPLRPEHDDLWIVTTTEDDAIALAKLTMRDFYPEDNSSRERSVTTRRQPTFAAAMASVPRDVAVYFSATRDVDDHAEIQKLHPAAPNVSETIRWSVSGYEISARNGFFRETIGVAPTPFAARLDEARRNLLAAVGPGFDSTLHHLNASPILAALLPTLTRPAAEAVSHWLKRLGTGELPRLTIPSRGLASDLRIQALAFESCGINLHASFMLNVGAPHVVGYDVHVTEYEVRGLLMPDTAAAAFDLQAREGRLMLSEIVDLPGAERVRVRSVPRRHDSWSALLDPESVPIELPVSDLPFEADDEMRRIAEDGRMVDGIASNLLDGMGRERASFVLYCTENGSSGMDFDVTPWMPNGAPTEMRLRDGCFSLYAMKASPLLVALGDRS